LAGHAGELRARGVQTTTFGVGADFDEGLLEAMARAGGGNFYYIADARAIADYITSEVGEALDVVARDVTVEVTTPDAVVVESVSPFSFAQRGGRTVVNLGSLVAAQVVQVVLRLTFPLGEIGRETGAVVSLSARDAVANGASASLDWAYADGETNDRQKRNADVDRAVARAFAARARQEATTLNRAGNFPAAQAALNGVAKRIRRYAGRDAEMRGLVAELAHDAQNLSVAMSPAALKAMHFASYASAKMRKPDGTASRRTRP
jgi:Ca-activated chloride channel family protein